VELNEAYLLIMRSF